MKLEFSSTSQPELQVNIKELVHKYLDIAPQKPRDEPFQARAIGLCLVGPATQSTPGRLYRRLGPERFL
jgi:hypothetical protein